MHQGHTLRLPLAAAHEHDEGGRHKHSEQQALLGFDCLKNIRKPPSETQDTLPPFAEKHLY